MPKTPAIPETVLQHVQKETGANPFFVQAVVASLVNAILIEAEQGKEVTINPLGKFVIRQHIQRKSYNPGMIPGHDTIPACKVLRFIPGRRIKKFINRTKGKNNG